MAVSTRLSKVFFRETFLAVDGLALLLAILTSGCTTELPRRTWGSPETANLDGVLPAYIDPDKAAACQEEQCTFQLRYFVGGNKFIKSRKTILYISGGPGSIVSPNNRDLAFLEDFYNVVYFDIRGAGRSQLPPSNHYDKYLRAKYVVSDIEALRQSLGIEFWDAIYAHSSGTIVAQQYAHRYGKKSQHNPSPRVLKLILSAPLARHLEIEAQRRSQRIRNLDSIYSQYSKNCSCSADQPSQDAQSSKSHNEDANTPKAKIKGFCFLASGQKQIIEARLADMMKSLEDRYGSIRMVSENYQELIHTGFAESYPFPRGFFSALTVLDSYGAKHYFDLPELSDSREAPEEVKKQREILAKFLKNLTAEQREERTRFVQEFNKKTFDAAFVLGYFASTNYLSIQQRQESCRTDPTCWAENKKDFQEAFTRLRDGKPFPKDFLSPDTPDCLRYSQGEIDSYRPAALQNLTTIDSDLSLRAYYVFGLYDGLSGWLAKQTVANLEDGQEIPCVSDETIKKVTQNARDLVVRKHLKRIGISPNESICPWNPSNYNHSVPTLILRGDEDPVTAGGQALDVFSHGLVGDRILVELKETAHDMIHTIEEQVALAVLLTSFIDNQKIQDLLTDPRGRICDRNSYYEVQKVVTAGGQGCPAP